MGCVASRGQQGWRRALGLGETPRVAAGLLGVWSLGFLEEGESRLEGEYP